MQTLCKSPLPSPSGPAASLVRASMISGRAARQHHEGQVQHFLRSKRGSLCLHTAFAAQSVRMRPSRPAHASSPESSRCPQGAGPTFHGCVTVLGKWQGQRRSGSLRIRQACSDSRMSKAKNCPPGVEAGVGTCREGNLGVY